MFIFLEIIEIPKKFVSKISTTFLQKFSAHLHRVLLKTGVNAKKSNFGEIKYRKNTIWRKLLEIFSYNHGYGPKNDFFVIFDQHFDF